MDEVTYMGEGAGHPLPSRVANVPRRQIACASRATTDRHDHRQASEGGAYRGGGYARVSSSDQRSDLDGQVARVVEFVTHKGWPVVRTVTEVGSGLNAHRPKLMKVLADPSIAIVAVEHRDRLLRFGAE